MEEIILTLMPTLNQYPILLVFTDICSFMFFGGFVFSGLWNLIYGWTIPKNNR